MPIVPAGNETGLYYIPVAGLPWQCSWQKLKDFARNKQPDGSWIEVEHALIYPHPHQTNGWVSVRGRDHFLNVLAHLNGGVLEGRSLLADGRNESTPVNLCDLGTDTPSPQQRIRNNSVLSIATETSCSSGGTPLWPSVQQPYTPQQETFSEWNMPQSSQFSPVFSNSTYYQPPSPAYETPTTAYPVTQSMEYFTPQSSIIYAGNMVPSIPVYVPQQQQALYPCFQMAGPVGFNSAIMSPPSTNRALQQPPTNMINGPMVQTEARKVIIKGLPRDTSESALTTLIDHLCSRPSSRSSFHPTIHSMELVRHRDGKPKGHAFVVFDNHRIAKKVASAVDGHKFQGRDLRASLAKEGVEPKERSTLRQHGHLTPDSPSAMYAVDERQFQLPASVEPPLRERQDARRAGDGAAKAASSKGKEKGKDVGSNRERGKGGHKSRDPRATPVVVDGSGNGRRRSH